MATRSTKIRNSRAVKLSLTAIIAIFVFFAVYLFEGLYYFYSRNSLPLFYIDNTEGVLGGGTTGFAEEIREDADMVLQICSTYISDEAVDSGESFVAFEEDIKKETEKQIKSTIRETRMDEIENMYVYDDDTQRYTYPYTSVSSDLLLNDFSSDDQVLADNRANTMSGRGITVVKGKEYYKGFPLDQVVINEAPIRKMYEEEMQNKILSQRAEFRADYERKKNHLASLVNFEYFFLNKETGEIYTNTKATSIKELSKDMSDFTACIVAGDMRVSEEMIKMVENAAGTSDYSIYYNKYYSGSYDTAPYYNAIFTGSIPFDSEKFDAYIHVNTKAETLVEGDEYYSLFNDYTKQSSELIENITAFGICVILGLLTLILLVYLSGNVKEDGTIKLAPIDKVPNSIHFVVSGIICTCLITWGAMLYYDRATYGDIAYFERYTKLSALVMALAFIFFIEWLLSVARQAKNGTYFKNTITALLIIPLIKKAVRWWKSDQNRIMSKSIKTRILLPLIAYAILTPLAASLINFAWIFLPLTIALVILFIYYVAKFSVGLASVDSALMDAEQGNFDYNIDVEDLPTSIKSLGERTNNLTKGMKVAVGDAVRNEHMKTELITNVSHDLKTPLTSIITYTDLLKMSNIQDEKAKEYVSVLDEKATRLKKLIEDLVEASKVSSGNVKLVLSDININEMVEQIYGEYEDDLNSVNLSLRCNFPEDPVIAVADGQKTYRIIENLFSNVKKYAMPDTRVYLDVLADDTFAIIDMKNISKEEMHFSIENLAERFVRGDESRTTEGSGLGLSIAKSLTEIQGGKFELSTEGDLFKVVIKLPLAKD